MTAFLSFAGVFLVFGWLTYRMIRYTNDSVGARSPLIKLVVYRYSERDCLKWRQTPFILFIALVLVWPCWILITALNTATSSWPYALSSFSLYAQVPSICSIRYSN
ncbi:hypothetical protein [Fibrella arboris]|uniref:hypothetical protein n=1 Tax=Fibrella arboris TaxID=3242486 RepID=UPI003522D667